MFTMATILKHFICSVPGLSTSFGTKCSSIKLTFREELHENLEVTMMLLRWATLGLLSVQICLRYYACNTSVHMLDDFYVDVDS